MILQFMGWLPKWYETLVHNIILNMWCQRLLCVYIYIGGIKLMIGKDEVIKNIYVFIYLIIDK